MTGLFTLSVVSHHHGVQVQTLITQLATAPAGLIDKVIVTLNLPERPPRWDNACLLIVNNPQPRGFGANHNHAFSLCKSPYFCVINPDVELTTPENWGAGVTHMCTDVHDRTVKSLFDALVQTLANPTLPVVGATFPVQCRSDGSWLDFARPLVTPKTLFTRKWSQLVDLIWHADRIRRVNAFNINISKNAAFDWASGAFLVFRTEAFAAMRGFDERYFMYCEDIDICLRLQLNGYAVAQADSVVVHHTQRQTLKNTLHFFWHVKSLLRLWQSEAYHAYIKRKLKNKI